ncbi:MAG TPA: hypothetical protein RMH99_00405, partial [Sandaracinaceae bacterium LLY-WYZ-13_1]|nr:hypothetical protein [Sandaracinaceae bacterium LLY-WYZ-13_1]
MTRRRPPRRSLGVWLLALATLFGCDDDEPREDPCEARIDAMAERLARAAAVAEPAGAPIEIPLPEAAPGTPLEAALPLLVIGAD